MSVMRIALRKAGSKGDVTPGRVRQHGITGRHTQQRGLEHDPENWEPDSEKESRSNHKAPPLHIVVVRILADIADIQNDGLGAQILPPVRGAEHFGSNIAALVQNGLRTVAG